MTSFKRFCEAPKVFGNQGGTDMFSQLVGMMYKFALNSMSSPVSVIAVSYEARDYGVTRNMWVEDAKKLCPDLQVARVRESHGKADLTL